MNEFGDKGISSDCTPSKNNSNGSNSSSSKDSSCSSQKNQKKSGANKKSNKKQNQRRNNGQRHRSGGPNGSNQLTASQGQLTQAQQWENELTSKIYATMEKHKEVFFVIRLHSVHAATNLPSIIDPDALVNCDLMDGRDNFLTMAREKHHEFSSLRRAKFSTMNLLYELHNSSKCQSFQSCPVHSSQVTLPTLRILSYHAADYAASYASPLCFSICFGEKEHLSGWLRHELLAELQHLLIYVLNRH